SDDTGDHDSKPVWRTGFGWLQLAVQPEPAATPTILIPQALGLSQGNISSTEPLPATSASVAEVQQTTPTPAGLGDLTADAKPIDSQPQPDQVPVPAAPLAFELKITTPESTPPPNPPQQTVQPQTEQPNSAL